MTDELPPCGHPECAKESDEWALAQALGFRQIQPGMLVFETTNPTEFLDMMRQMNAGVDGVARDIVIQAQALADRAADVAEEMRRNQEKRTLSEIIWHSRGRHHAHRKVVRRAFWAEVRGWLSRRRKRS